MASKKLPKLKKWQETAVKLKLYKTREIRKFSRMRDLPAEDIKSIRQEWARKQVKRNEQERLKLFKVKQQEPDYRKGDKRIRDFQFNGKTYQEVYDPITGKSEGRITSYETLNPIRDKDLIDMIRNTNEPTKEEYYAVDKTTGEVVGRYRLIEDEYHQFQYIRINDNGVEEDRAEAIPKPIFDKYFSTAPKHEEFRSNESDEEEYSEEYDEEEPSYIGDYQEQQQVADFINEQRKNLSAKSYADYLDEKIDEVVSQIPFPIVKQEVTSIIEEAKSKIDDYAKIDGYRAMYAIEYIQQIQDIFYEDYWYYEIHLYESMAGTYSMLTGKALSHGDKKANDIYLSAKAGANEMIQMRAKMEGFHDVEAYKAQAQARRKKEELD